MKNKAKQAITIRLRTYVMILEAIAFTPFELFHQCLDNFRINLHIVISLTSKLEKGRLKLFSFVKMGNFKRFSQPYLY